LLSFVEGNGATSVDFSPVRGGPRNHSLKPHPEQRAQAKDAIEQLVTLKQDGARVETPVARLHRMIPFLFPEENDPDVVVASTLSGNATHCVAPLRDMHICPSGNVRFCSTLPAISSLKQMSLGDLARGSWRTDMPDGDLL
jgi:MoaA/NifB/PqqE/SkfB family radical SAM enzyme